MIKAPQQQIPGVYHHRVGDIVVTALSDGFLDGSLDVLRNISQDEARQILADNFRPARRTAVNAFLVFSAGRLALIETGSGNYLLPTAGKLLANLQAAGVAAADIEAVLLTHMHPDHSAGLTDMTSGKRNFPNAELSVHETMTAKWPPPANAPRTCISNAGADKPRPTSTARVCSRQARFFPV